METINTHIDSADVCEQGCWMLLDVSGNIGKIRMSKTVENETNR